MTVDANRVSLLPCPFCGSPAAMEPWHGGGPDKQLISCSSETCDACPAVTGETPTEAIAAWNRRSPSLSGGEVATGDWHMEAVYEQIEELQQAAEQTDNEPMEALFSDAADMALWLLSQLEAVERERDEARAEVVAEQYRRGETGLELEAAEARANAALEALTRIAAIKYPAQDTHYALKATIDYARDQASQALPALNGAKP